MPLTKEEVEGIAQATATAVVERLNGNLGVEERTRNHIFFEPCQRCVDTQSIKGESCNSTGDTYYHHSDVRKLPGIRANGALKASPDPWADGTVNFSLNPNLHRFGSVRFVFDRSKVEEATSTQPMCYAAGEDIWKEAEVVDRIQQERAKQGQAVGRWRIEHELGVETPVYRNECKRYSTQLVLLKYVKEVEYWVPWKSLASLTVRPAAMSHRAMASGLRGPLAFLTHWGASARRFSRLRSLPSSWRCHSVSIVAILMPPWIEIGCSSLITKTCAGWSKMKIR